MTYDVTVRLTITDHLALYRYVKSIVSDYGMDPADITELTPRDAIRWLYDPLGYGTVSFPGTTIDDCTIEQITPVSPV